MKTGIVSILISSTVLCLCSVSSFAQSGYLTPQEIESRGLGKIYAGIYRYTPAWFTPSELNSQSIDQCSMRITFEAKIVCDTLTGVKYNDRMVVEIGSSCYKSYGESLWKNDMFATIGEADSQSEQYSIESGYQPVIASTTYRELDKGIIADMWRIPWSSSAYYYKEPQPVFIWTLGNETKEIKGYMCQSAHTEFRGRRWTVWFTPEVPVDCGFWKFSGLPGLILEAYDSKEEYWFTVRSIEATDCPLYFDSMRGKTVSRTEFRKTEKNLHDNPILYEKGINGYLSIIDDKRNLTGREIFTVDNFLCPYNPMELE